MTTPNPRHQYIVVRFVLSHPVVAHFIVFASADYDRAQAYCDERNEQKESHETFMVINRHDYELEYGEAKEQ